jgi:hypothetical protein
VQSDFVAVVDDPEVVGFATDRFANDLARSEANYTHVLHS